MSYFYISSAVHNVEYNLLCARGGSCLRKLRRDNLVTGELRRISKMAVFGILGQGREGRRQQAAKTTNNQKTKRLEIGTGGFGVYWAVSLSIRRCPSRPTS